MRMPPINILKAPIRILFVNKISSVYGSIDEHNEHFKLTDDAAIADIIMFENHSIKFIRDNVEFQKWPEKCVIVNSEDKPSYFLPGCYSSNYISFFSRGRAKTIPYIRMEREGPNFFIEPADSAFQPKYLYSFRGGATSWLRKKMFKKIRSREDVFIAETNHYYHWSMDLSYMDQKALLQKEYADLVKNSLFFLCPKGVGSSSIRLFEIMKAGRVPVIISDNWIPIEGFNWDEFSIRVPEKDIDRIDDIIRQKKDKAYMLGARALEIYDNFFAPGPDLLLIANALREIQQNRNETKERFIRSLFPIIEATQQLKSKGYETAKYLVLKAFALTGRKFPYSLNRPLEEQLNKADKN